MSTRTDFYVGTGTAAEWIGSLQFGCHPDALLQDWYGNAALTSRTETAYRDAVDQLLFTWAVNGLGAAHQPRHGWPWPWNTSHCADWIITWAKRMNHPAESGAHATTDVDADTGRQIHAVTSTSEDRGIYLTAGGGTTWHHLDPDDPRPPLRCGPPDFAHWLSDPAAPPAVTLPLHHDAPPPSTDTAYHWWD
jgi:hypothetical protein